MKIVGLCFDALVLSGLRSGSVCVGFCTQFIVCADDRRDDGLPGWARLSIWELAVLTALPWLVGVLMSLLQRSECFFFKTILDNSRRLVSHSSNVLSISSLFVAFVCKIQIICLQQRLLICLYLSWYASFSVARCPGIIGRVLVACSS